MALEEDHAYRYEKLGVLGEGTFGVVHKAREVDTGRIVAIKKLRMLKREHSDGIDFTSLREIGVLQETRHPNVVELLDVYKHKANVNLVFEYLETDLDAVIKDATIPLRERDVKAYMRMLLAGVAHLHSKWVIHRDLKPDNLLIHRDGTLKIADFGLARFFGSPNPKYTHSVVTRWYRAPELLFGARAYGSAVDMWSVGCIFAEMMLRVPYFAGESDMQQLGKIFAALGTPSAEDWEGMETLPAYIAFENVPGTPLAQLFPNASPAARALLSQLLAFDPLKRPSAAEALEHEYFKIEPQPTPTHELQLPDTQQKDAAALRAEDEERAASFGALSKRLDFGDL